MIDGIRVPHPAHVEKGVAYDVGGQPHVALKHLTEGMGLDWESQHARVGRDAILSSTMVMTTIVANSESSIAG